MWVQRTQEEEAKWRAAAEKGARFHGWMIGLLGWCGAVILSSAGWMVSFSRGVVFEWNDDGTFWKRVLTFGALTSPVIFIARRLESRSALRKEMARTICPKCDTAAEGNAGAACQCGGAYVPVSAMKWVE